MFEKPVVPDSPVMLKETIIVVAVWFVAIWALLICVVVTFPVVARFTVEPLSVTA